MQPNSCQRAHTAPCDFCSCAVATILYLVKPRSALAMSLDGANDITMKCSIPAPFAAHLPRMSVPPPTDRLPHDPTTRLQSDCS